MNTFATFLISEIMFMHKYVYVKYLMAAASQT